MKIFTTGNPFAPGLPTQEALKRRAAEWEASEAIDMVLIGYSALWPQNVVTSSMIASVTERLGLIVAHRPGVMHPAHAARMFGSLDFLSGGDRLALNIVSGSSDKDIAREGDYTPKPERYARATDYVEFMKKAWTDEAPFDWDTAYAKADGVRVLMKPIGNHIPIYMGGESDEAVDFGAKHANTYMLWGEPVAGTMERIERVRGIAKEKYGRELEFSLSLRLFLGDTDEAAWAEARRVEQVVIDAQGSSRFLRSAATDKSVGRDRQLATAQQDTHDDGVFWTGLVKLLGGFANSAALVGTPDRVFEALRRYRDLGVSAFLLTTGEDGFWDPSIEEFAVRVKREL